LFEPPLLLTGFGATRGYRSPQQVRTFRGTDANLDPLVIDFHDKGANRHTVLFSFNSNPKVGAKHHFGFRQRIYLMHLRPDNRGHYEKRCDPQSSERSDPTNGLRHGSNPSLKC
jgi:hypothetical protein